MAAKVDLEVLGVIENMSAFTGPDGERVAIFGEGGGQLLADELDVPLLARCPSRASSASTPTRASRWWSKTPTLRRPR
jgi:Mrp family chromosome partitioning ATPase